MSESNPLYYFPYEPRGDQKRVIFELYKKASRGEKILFQAPTGYGKTPVILAALLPLSLEWDIPILWAVRTGGETDRIIEELRNIVYRTNLDIFGLSLRGKADMCLLAREMNIRENETVNELCKHFKKKCIYYQNLQKYAYRRFYQPITFSETLKYSKANRVCPYYLQFQKIGDAQVISLNYNYILVDYFFQPIRRIIGYSGAILVVDEAHNLEKVVSNLFSTKISITTIKRAISELLLLGLNDSNMRKDLEKLLLFMKREGDKIVGEDDLFDPNQLIDLIDLNFDKIDKLKNFAKKVILLKISEGKAPFSSLNRLASFLETLLTNLNTRGIAFLKYVKNGKVFFEIWDMRISEHLVEKWSEYETIIFTSGTLYPYQAFADVVGLGDYSVVEGKFEIPSENVLSMIVKGVTTRGEELSEENLEKYMDFIDIVLKNINTNLAIFFASYRIQQYFTSYLEKRSRELGRKIYIETENMSGDEVMKTFKKFINDENAVLVGVMGGKFSEGLDYPGKSLEAIVLIGIPFERVTKKTELYIKYFEEIYGSEKGRYYAYIVPALRKASQALGRAIRSPKDRGILIAADERYSYPKYFNLLPEFFKQKPIIIKNHSKLLEYIEIFKRLISK